MDGAWGAKGCREVRGVRRAVRRSLGCGILQPNCRSWHGRGAVPPPATHHSAHKILYSLSPA